MDQACAVCKMADNEYQDETGQPNCKAKLGDAGERGVWTSATASPVCEPCPAGQYSFRGLQRCLPCREAPRDDARLGVRALLAAECSNAAECANPRSRAVRGAENLSNRKRLLVSYSR